MSWLAEIMIIAGFFIVRLGAPLVVLFTAGYLLRRWEGRRRTEFGKDEVKLHHRLLHHTR